MYNLHKQLLIIIFGFYECSVPQACPRKNGRARATEDEVTSTIEEGERFEAKFGRVGFRRNFAIAGKWRGKDYNTKQVEVYAVQEDKDWLVITILTRYF